MVLKHGMNVQTSLVVMPFCEWINKIKMILVHVVPAAYCIPYIGSKEILSDVSKTLKECLLGSFMQNRQIQYVKYPEL